MSTFFSTLVFVITAATAPIPDICPIVCRDAYLTCLFACEWEDEPSLACDAAYAACRADCDEPVAAPAEPASGSRVPVSASQ